MHWSEAEYQAYLTRQHRQPTHTAPSRADTAMPEAELLSRVRTLAKRHGWLCYHTRDSRGSEEGFPDLVLVNPERVIFAELKAPSGKLTERQAVWLEMLRHTGRVEVYLWRPGDWSTIVTCLGSSQP